jgi:murein DD-endopeptidase MepM/ murein hydrolase activator NlpD
MDVSTSAFWYRCGHFDQERSLGMAFSRPEIVADRLARQPRRGLRYGLIGVASLSLFGVVTAFGTAPETLTQPYTLSPVVDAVALPDLDDGRGAHDAYWQDEKLRSGDTLASVLGRMGVDAPEAAELVSDAGSDLRDLRSGRRIQAQTTDAGELRALRYTLPSGETVEVKRTDDGFVAKRQDVVTETRAVMRSGRIRSSLFGATDAANIPDGVASQMAEVFSGDIDFHQDLRRGDQFTVVYEGKYSNGEQVGAGRLLAAEFINQGKTYQAVWYRDPQGREGYYSAKGDSLKKAFLKSPLEFSRITSGFTNARFHPVLKTWRAHKGVDYGAPTGTRVRAVADSVVAFAGRQGGYGNLVILKHNGQYSTAYGHLSRFGSGMRTGARVAQGQIIGYVGSTGLASGPHLHYEFRVNGVQRNPLAMKLPSNVPLASQYKRQFLAHAAPLAERLNLLRGTNLAALD